MPEDTYPSPDEPEINNGATPPANPYAWLAELHPAIQTRLLHGPSDPVWLVRQIAHLSPAELRWALTEGDLPGLALNVPMDNREAVEAEVTRLTRVAAWHRETWTHGQVSVYSSAREALRLCYDCFGRLNDAERDLQAMAPPAVRRQHPAAKGGGTEIVGDIRMVNGRPTRVVNTEELIAAAERALDRVAPAVDRRVAELNRYRETLASRVATALDTPARRTPEGLALASEVRAHIKAMKQPAARAKFVMDAIAEGDLPTVAAVLHAPPFLCGIDPAMHATIRARAAAKFAPVDSAQLEAADAAIERVKGAGSAIVKRLGGVVAFRNAPVAKASRSLRALADG